MRIHKSNEENLNIAEEREHMILWRKVNKTSKNCTGKRIPKVKGKALQPKLRIGQEPQGTSNDSPDESEENCYIIREGSTQAIEATSTLDISVDAVNIRDYPQ